MGLGTLAMSTSPWRLQIETRWRPELTVLPTEPIHLSSIFRVLNAVLPTLQTEFHKGLTSLGLYTQNNGTPKIEVAASASKLLYQQKMARVLAGVEEQQAEAMVAELE